MLTTLLPALLALYVAEESSMANPTVASTVGGHKVTHKPTLMGTRRGVGSREPCGSGRKDD